MKWMLVVLVMGASPVKTNLMYDTLQECLDSEDVARGEIADAYNRWYQWASENPEQANYPDNEIFIKGKIGMSNLSTCIPHAPL